MLISIINTIEVLDTSPNSLGVLGLRVRARCLGAVDYQGRFSGLGGLGRGGPHI